MKDALFLAGVFFEYNIPRDKQFLLHYFRSPLERQFVKYYLCFGEIENFVDHTGFFCQKRWLRILKKRIEKILGVHESYKNNLELDKLREIEDGHFEL